MVFWKHRNDGRAAHAHETVAGAVHHGPTEADVRAAFEQGRLAERKRHRSHPILGLLVFAVALVGGVMLFLAASEGSFSQAGAVADRKIEQARVEGPDVIRDVALGGRNDDPQSQQILAQTGDAGAR